MNAAQLLGTLIAEEQDISLFRWGRFGRGLILLFAWICAHIGQVTIHEQNADAATSKTSVLASGYYVIARKG